MNAAPRGCVWEIFRDQSLIVTYCDDASTRDQWREYTAMMRSFQGNSATRHLVYADAPPPAYALMDLANAARGQPWVVALLSPSTAVRFAASTFSLVVKGFRFFVPEQLDAAMFHIGCDIKQQHRAREALRRLRGQ
jgi:hypothetical protein